VVIDMDEIKRGLAGIGVFLCLAGCNQGFPQSPYHAQYANSFREVRLPDTGHTEPYVSFLCQQSFDAAWETVLQVAAQSTGIIAFDATADERRIMIVRGRANPLIEARGMHGTHGTVRQFMETWLIIAVHRENSPDRCGVRIWQVALRPEGPIVSSVTHPLVESPDPGVLNGDFTEMRALQLARERLNSEFDAKQMSADTQWKRIPDQAAYDVLSAIVAQSRAPEWEGKVKGRDRTNAEVNLAALRGVENDKPIADNIFAIQWANWASLSFRRGQHVIGDPKLSENLGSIAHRLLRAVGRSDRQVTIYVVDSPVIWACAMPNGDVFVYTGLLEAIDGEDEIAFVLAHELDHVLQEDVIRDIENRRAATIELTLLVVGISAASFGVAEAAVVGAELGAAASGVILSGTSNAVYAATPLLVAYGAMGSTYTSGGTVQNAMLMQYSRDEELRADTNAVRYLAAAGFDPAAGIRVMMSYRNAINAARAGTINHAPQPIAGQN